jgi:hypothetical protein
MRERLRLRSFDRQGCVESGVGERVLQIQFTIKMQICGIRFVFNFSMLSPDYEFTFF